VLLAFTALTVLPVWFLTTAAFKSAGDFSVNELGAPSNWTLSNYSVVFSGGQFFTWLENSLILSVVAIAASVGVGFTSAFAVVIMRLRGRRLITNVIVSLMAVSPIVLVLPLFVSVVQLGLIDQRLPVIVIYTGLLIPQSFFLLTSFLRTIPLEFIHAAVIDGAKPRHVLRLIVWPLAGPAVVTLALANAVFTWNELLIALIFLPSEAHHTLMVGMATFATLYNVNIPVVCSGLLLASLPMVIFYLAGQRYFVQGLMGGGLK
jgi:raffinose/stachyose/melibiose transport system permease protein